jgi:selT/selW/selH-like putative selenoprotein
MAYGSYRIRDPCPAGDRVLAIIRPGGLIKGQDGVFEVEIDGDLIYSKRNTGRFPDAGEVEDLLAPKIGG